MKSKTTKHPVFIAFLLVLISSGINACKRERETEFHAIDVSGSHYARYFSVPDAAGRIRSLSDFEGSIVYIFFGFTNCPGICPTTMADLASVKKMLGSEGNKLQLIFVTVDPDRDTPEILQAYVKAFDNDAIALVGNSEQLAEMAREFKVVYRKIPGPLEGMYSMDHSAGGYIYDNHGKLRLYSKYGMPVDQLASDVKKLIRGN